MNPTVDGCGCSKGVLCAAARIHMTPVLYVPQKRNLISTSLLYSSHTPLSITPCFSDDNWGLGLAIAANLHVPYRIEIGRTIRDLHSQDKPGKGEYRMCWSLGLLH